MQDGTKTKTKTENRAQAGVWEGLEDMRGALRAFLVRHCPDENDVEDVIQETFLRAARYRRAHRVQSLRPWAMRIALNVLADARRRGLRSEAQEENEEPFDPPASPEPPSSAFRVGSLWLDGDCARDLLLRALGELREKDRGLLDSYYGGELKTSVSARDCGIPRALVKVRLYRARQRLLADLQHRVSRESTWALRAS